MSFDVRQLARLELDQGTLRVWTGREDYELEEPDSGDEHTYVGGLSLLAADPDGLAFGMSGQDVVGSPIGNRRVTVFFVASRDGGAYRLLPVTVRGVLSAPRLSRGQLRIGIESFPARASGERWSNETHRAGRPDDTFFGQRRALATGKAATWFPRVPNFDPDGEYDNRKINIFPDKLAVAQELGGSPRAGGIVVVGTGSVASRATVPQVPAGV